jgi:hypothetical protein
LGDLSCVDVEYCEGLRNIYYYKVYIEEASPDTIELQDYIIDKLSKLGYDNIEIITEW